MESVLIGRAVLSQDASISLLNTMYSNPFLFIYRSEIQLIRLKSAILALFSALLYSALPATVFTSVFTLSATGTELTTYNMFMILSLYGTIRISICWHIAQAAISLGDFSTSVRRIQLFLEMFECSVKKRLKQSFFDYEDKQLCVGKVPSGIPHAEDEDSGKKARRVNVCMKDVVCSWRGTRQSSTLNSVSLEVHDGEMIFITGPVGSGKTSLLLTLLGELPVYSGHVSRRGKIAYVAQQPWVCAGTLQDNILFGEPLDKRKYNMVIEACALLKDIQAFPDGHATMIGERGIVLSGGQRARIGLARAVYSDADIYLLDDPLSSVDAKVGRHISEQCLNNVLSTKLRIVATHSLQYLMNAENIVLIDKGSILLNKGNYEELRKFDCMVLGDAMQKSGDLEKIHTLHSGVKETKLCINVEDAHGLETAEEDRMSGSVNWRLYWDYLRAGISVKLLLLLATFFTLVQGKFIQWSSCNCCLETTTVLRNCIFIKFPSCVLVEVGGVYKCLETF